MTRRDARSHGPGIAGIVWLAVSVFGAGGLYYSRAGILVAPQRHGIGGIGMRPLIFAVGALPFSYWVYRFERNKEIGKASRRTTCPRCGKAGEEPVGTMCGCGESLVPQSAMKWVDGDETGHDA